MKSLTKIAAFAALLAAGLGCGTVAAQSWPSRPVRIVVPFPAGGPADVLARVIGEKMAPAWGQQVLVDNRPGANTIIGAEAVAKAAPDGHTLLMAIDSTLVMNQALYTKLPYDPIRDFAPVSLTAVSPLIMVTDAAKGPKSVAELIQMARANPGKVNFGAGTITTQLAGELFKRALDLDIVYVPYKGSAGTVQGLLSNDVTFTLDGVITALPHIRSGRFRVLAGLSNRPITALPDLPQVRDFPGLADFEVSVWLGLVAPAGTPATVVTRVSQDLSRVLAMPDTRERYAAAGLEPVSNTPAEFASFIRKEAGRWAPIIKAAGIKLD